MKKKFILLVCISILYANYLFSQHYAIEKNASILSGGLSFSYSGGKLFESSAGNGLTTIALSPSFNYFVASNFFIGGTISLTNMSQGDVSMTTIGIGPQLGYYFGTSKSTSFPYLTAGIKYNSTKFDEASENGTDILFGAGLLFPIKEHIGFSIEVDYHIVSMTSSGSSAESGHIISLGLAFSGLLY